MGISESKGGRPVRSGKKPFTEIFRQLILGETQQEAADKIGVSRQNIGKWLSGSTTPDIETLCRIADAYNVTTDYLLGRTTNKTTDMELQTVCDYTGLSDKSIDIIKQISNETEIFFLNLLFETGEITKIVEIISRYALYQGVKLLSAKGYKKLQEWNSDPSEYERKIKECRENTEYLETSASIQIRKSLDISARSLAQARFKMNEVEYNELLDLANSFFKGRGLTLSVEELLNDIEKQEGADEDG